MRLNLATFSQVSLTLQVDGLRNMLLRKKLAPAAASTQPRVRDPDVFDRIGNNRNGSVSNSSSTYSRTTLNADRNTQEQQKSVKSRLSLPNKSGLASIRITSTNRSMRYINIKYIQCGPNFGLKFFFSEMTFYMNGPAPISI